jgi:hypothetical protein
MEINKIQLQLCVYVWKTFLIEWVYLFKKKLRDLKANWLFQVIL